MSAEAPERLHALLERLCAAVLVHEDDSVSGPPPLPRNSAGADEAHACCVKQLLCEAIQACVVNTHGPPLQLAHDHMSLLLTCLEAGHVEAAQLLFLTVPGGGGTHTASSPWLPFVHARLAAQAMLPARETANASTATTASAQQLGVIACRLLAADAAARCAVQHTDSGPLAEPVLCLLRQLQASATAGGSSSSSAPSSTTPHYWPRSLGSDGIAALASLAAAASLQDAASFPRQEAASLVLGLWGVLHTHGHAPMPLVSAPAPAAAAAAAAKAPGAAAQTWRQLQALVETGDGQQQPVGAAPAGTSACCAARFVLLRSLAALALTDQAPADPLLLRGVQALVLQLMAGSPKGAAPTLDFHGAQAGFALLPGASTPCTAAASAAPAAAACHCQWVSPPAEASAALDGWLAAWGLAQPATLLEAGLQLLLVLCATGRRRAAAVLYAADISACLQQLCGFAARPVDLTPLLARLFTCLCVDSPALRDEVMADANLTALTGLIADLSGPATVPLRLQAAAMDRLSSALDTASGADFLAFVGAAPACSSTGGSSGPSGLAAVLRLLRAHCPHAGRTQQPEAPPSSSSSCRAAGAGSAEHRQLLASAQATLLAALGRARRMSGMSTRQLPRVGVLAQMPASELRALEAWCLAPAESSAAGSEAPVVPAAAAAAMMARASPQEQGGAAVQHRAPGAGASRSKRSAGSASPGHVGAGRNAAAASGCGDSAQAAGTADGGGADGYDEDGLRTRWSSGPSAGVAAAREAWKALSLRECLDWKQSSSDVEVTLLLPAGTRKEEVVVSLQADRLAVRLGWRGRVLDGPLKARIKPSEACWSLSATEVQVGRRGGGAPNSTPVMMTELLLVLPKEAGGRYWRALFEGGEERSHLQVLQDAVEEDARHAPRPDELGAEAQLLLEDLRERQAALASGEWSFERHFDDFRLVLGDNTL